VEFRDHLGNILKGGPAMKKLPYCLMILCALTACGRKNPAAQPSQALHFPPPVLEHRKIGNTERHIYATMPLGIAAQSEAGLSGVLFKHDFRVDPDTLATNVYMKNGDVYRYACMPLRKDPGILYFQLQEVKRGSGDDPASPGNPPSTRP
jgi:predicted small lipoprotein YifL